MKRGIGITTKCCCGDTFQECIHNIRSAGFDAVMVDAANMSPDELGRCIGLAKRAGLGVPYVHLNCADANNMWAHGEAHKQFIQNLKASIDACARNGVPVAVFHASYNSKPEVSALPVSLHTLDTMRGITNYAAKRNVKLAIENIDRANLEHLYFLLDNITSPYFGFCYDSGHHMLFAPEIDYLARYGDRLFAVHLQDNQRNSPVKSWKDDQHMLPGDGKIDFDKIAADIAKSCYRGVVMLEVNRSSPSNLYNNMPADEYLKRAYECGTKIANKIN